MTGFFVHRDSRTESLAKVLFTALDRERPAQVLAPQTVVVAHPGLGRWLLGEFARRGPRGIAANFDLIQPWQWLERAAGQVLGNESDANFAKENLRWHVHALLPALDYVRVRRLLDGTDGDRRRFQLADRLAGVYSQYLIYRPDWLDDWQSGRAKDWQAMLWQQLRQRIAGSHRAQRHAQLIAALAARGDGALEPLHLFGISHLPADILAALQAVSAHRAVHLYFPDPCREYWGDLKSKRELLRKGEIDEAWHYEIGHPLLVSLGRMAQDFFIALENAGVDLDAGELESSESDSSLLTRLQQGIRRGDGAGMDFATPSHADASLRVHACATRLRELEVLKDALLRFLAEDSSLLPRQIVVMAPDISAYAPYLPAVFGAAAHHSADPSRIPWHLADVRLAQTHPLLRAFATLLDLGESRLALSEVLDLLDVPAVARRFRLDGVDREVLESTLRRAGVAWGLDAAMKQQFAGVAAAENSWTFGFDRIFAGAIAGADTDDALLDGVLPLAGVDGSAVVALGRVHRLLDVVREMRDGFARPRPLADWCEWLGERIAALFHADADDRAETRALDALRRALAELGEQAAASGKQELPWSVMREAMRGQLDAVSERQPFLLGGVTFCGLVPQRSIPFRVVCLLGMNDGEFPRDGGDAGLNFMLKNPRRGDRDTRREDRYLFLEALMAARRHLHISYVGRDVHDGKRIDPAAPLAELLQFLDDACAPAAGESRPWLVAHPLQPFDARYFDHSGQRDTRLFSYNADFRKPADAKPAPTTFIAWANDARADSAEPRVWTLDRFARFWRDPLAAQLRDGAGIDREALEDDASADSEPLTSRFDRRERMESRIVLDALRRKATALAETAPDTIARSGRLAGGAIGASAWQGLRESARPLFEALRRELGTDAHREPRPVGFDIDGMRIAGSVRDVYARADGSYAHVGLRLHRAADFGDLLPFYIRHAAMRLSDIDAAPVFLEEAKSASATEPALLAAIRAQDPAQLREGLRTLLAIARESASKPVLFPAKTAWAWSTTAPEQRSKNAWTAWHGTGFNGGEGTYAPGYNALFARGVDFLDGESAAAKAFAQTCARVANVLDPQHTILLPERAGAPR